MTSTQLTTLRLMATESSAASQETMPLRSVGRVTPAGQSTDPIGSTGAGAGLPDSSTLRPSTPPSPRASMTVAAVSRTASGNAGRPGRLPPHQSDGHDLEGAQGEWYRPVRPDRERAVGQRPFEEVGHVGAGDREAGAQPGTGPAAE